MTRLRTSLRALGRSPLSHTTRLPWALTPVRLSSTSTPLKKTPLYDLHVAHGAKMVPYAGFSMPIQYSSLSVRDSHVFTRTKASLFDVSHMVQHTFSGPGAAAALERLSPSFLGSLAEGQGRLSALLWPTGGIVDDLMITRLGAERFHVVTNAACREKDLGFISEQLGSSGRGMWKVEDGGGLIAVQGPGSAAIMEEVVEGLDLKGLLFGHSAHAQIRLRDGSRTREVLITRGGYTGEDGFEISLLLPEGKTAGDAAREVTALTETLLDLAGPEELQLAGLGARDSLRLEAGMCLYGNELDDETTPAEAGLSWIVSPERRQSGGFTGAEVVLPQLVPKSKGGAGVERRRVGLVVSGAPARGGAELYSKDGKRIGVVTSGCPSPSLGKNIAMGYVRDGAHKSGTEVDVLVRGKKRAGVITKMPFVPINYYKGA